MRYVRVAVCIALALVVIDGYVAFRKLFAVETTTFSCERATGACAIDGDTEQAPALAAIRSVELRRTHVARQGPAYDITLQLADGSTRDLDAERAQQDDSVAEYRASVAAIRAFLADPSAPRLSTTFTYRASFGEKLYAVLTWLGITLLATLGVWWWRRGAAARR